MRRLSTICKTLAALVAVVTMLLSTLLSIATPASARPKPAPIVGHGASTASSTATLIPPTFDGSPIGDALGRSLAEDAANYLGITSCVGEVGGSVRAIDDCVYVVEEQGANLLLSRRLEVTPCRWRSSDACFEGHLVAERIETHHHRYYQPGVYFQSMDSDVQIAVTPLVRGAAPTLMRAGSVLSSTEVSSAGASTLFAILDHNGDVMHQEEVSYHAVMRPSEACHVMADASNGLLTALSYPESGIRWALGAAGVGLGLASKPVGGAISITAATADDGFSLAGLGTGGMVGGTVVQVIAGAKPYCESVAAVEDFVAENVPWGSQDPSFKEGADGNAASPFGPNVKVTIYDGTEDRIERRFTVEVEGPTHITTQTETVDGKVVRKVRITHYADGTTTIEIVNAGE